MNPRKFGPYFWGALHTACIDPGVDPKALYEFVHLYQYVLPCAKCRDSFREFLVQNPMPMTTDRAVLFKWSVDIHNQVNYKLGRPPMGLGEATTIWSQNPPESFYDFF
jgi:hypothetical protein